MIVPFATGFGSDVAAFLISIGLVAIAIIPFSFVFYILVECPFIGLRRRQH